MYWNELRGVRQAPERGEIDPGAIRGVLGDTIMLAREPDRAATFRLAGTRVCALFGRELKTEAFQPLWDTASRRDLDDLLDHACDESIGFVAGAMAHVDDGEPAALELLLLPLLHRGASDGRLIGTLAPMSRPAWLGMQAACTLMLTSWRHVGPQIDQGIVPRFADIPAEIDGRGWSVHDGGRR